MLPRAHRLTESSQFALAVRKGRRAGGPTLVMHVEARESDDPTLVGFVVSKAVGNAVTRNRVKRRLRAIAALRLERIPAGLVVVIRALPPSAAADFGALRADVDRLLDRLLTPAAA